MDPKNVDRVGKGFLAVAGLAVAAAAKKYGPKVAKALFEAAKKAIFKG